MKLFALMLFIYVILQIDGALEAGKKIPLLDIGAGVYPTTLFFNHSCAPNTLRINQGTRVRKINKLQSITLDHKVYLNHLSPNALFTFEIRLYLSRNEILKKVKK